MNTHPFAGVGRRLRPKLGLGLGAKAAKFRSLPRPLSSEQRIEYSKAIVAAIRKKHRDAILRCPDQIRRQRRSEEWRELYEIAMREKAAAVGIENVTLYGSPHGFISFSLVRENPEGVPAMTVYVELPADVAEGIDRIVDRVEERGEPDQEMYGLIALVRGWLDGSFPRLALTNQ